MKFGSALRSQYPDAASCACVIDGRNCSPERVSKRTMNFGQRWRTEEIVDVPYRIELPRAFLFDFLVGVLPEYIADCRAHPDPECALDVTLRAANWPDAGEVVRRPGKARPTGMPVRFQDA